MSRYPTYKIGRLGQTWITVSPLFAWSSLALGAAAVVAGIWLLSLSVADSLLFALLALLLHWLSDFAHQLGHAWAAQSTGYPMREMRFHLGLVRSYYPRDEPPLPAETHIRRALGGPPVSFLLGIMGLIFLLLLRPFGGFWYGLAVFFCLENLLVFFIGAFIPIPNLTDGWTLLMWWPKRGP